MRKKRAEIGREREGGAASRRGTVPLVCPGSFLIEERDREGGVSEGER